MFESVNSNYIKALGTYKYGFEIFAFGHWVHKRLERELSLNSHLVPLTIDLTQYPPPGSETKFNDILFFARPEQPRRCFELGVEALRLVNQQNQAIRIALFGADHLPMQDFLFHNYGNLHNLKTLSSIYRSSRVGVCFSTTNPSLVGYEMIASGLQLVDLAVPDSYLNFSGNDFVFYADLTPESIAKTIFAALSESVNQSERGARGRYFAERMPSDESIADTFARHIENRE